ncbi:hypothetical protein NJL88_33840 [Streptomyces sp. DK15]|uniref:hypothetical protein n=1 Tax=Streptomyces sp. DK15 TaxID=2957499 RepID=UPI0029AB355F|nr:hypothetical protein [Streptomyces sp. DK15]MDX2394963.1 hypothetical protein [Streptomyces sp. DK15]
MSNFPSGHFTITNKDTGLCLRARLGDSQDVSDYKEGTKYLASVTEPPVLELGPADGSIATAWYFHTAQDGSERLPFNQIASVAVRDLQNIGNYCVWLDASENSNARDARDAQKLFAGKVNDLPQDAKERLAKVIPDAWKTDQKAERKVVARSRANKNAQAVYERALKEGASEAQAEASAKQSMAGLIAERELKAPAEDLENWSLLCAEFSLNGGKKVRETDVPAKGVIRPGPKEKFDWSEDFVPAARVFLDAAANEGVLPATTVSGAMTALYGCGASRRTSLRYPKATYRWTTDGTYIYGADSMTVSAERTYWTDDQGYLVGKDKGGPGQAWTLAPWTPPPADRFDGESALFTGLFGPIATAFSRLLG